MINTLLTMSLTGGAVVLAWLAVDKLSRDRLSALWHDRILRLALFFMLVPVGRLWTAGRELFVDFLRGRTVDVPPIMPAQPVIVPDTVIATLPGVIPDVTVVPPAAPPIPESAPLTVSLDVFQLLTLLWAVGAAAMLCYKLWCYWRFRRLLGAERLPLSQDGMEVFWDCKAELGVSGVVGVYIAPAVPTPLATGLIWPVILLPDVPLEREELRYLFLHELTHIKRRDLWARFFALCGLVVHWYNPLMHLLNQKLKERSEQSCDEQVARSMSKAERLAYGGMLLKLAAAPVLGPSEWAVTLSTRESIQRRLSRVVKAGKLTRMDKAVAVVTAVGLLLCGLVAACSVKEPLAVEEPPSTQQEEPTPGPDGEEVDLPGPLVTPEPDLPAQTVPEIESVPGDPVEEPSIEVSPAVPEEGPAAQPMEENTPAPEVPDLPETMTIGDVVYETYVDEHGVVRLKDAVGNVKYLDLERLTLLGTLVDGKYPVNSRGETYGYAELADFVGREPDLIYTSSNDAAGYTMSGYVAREDYYADFSDPAVAAKYEEYPEPKYGVDPIWTTQPRWLIPLYDQEHNKIGVYINWERTVEEQGKLIWELEYDEMRKHASPDGAQGVITDPATGEQMEVKPTNHGTWLIADSIDMLEPENWPEELWKDLPDGAYPVNSKGESYGTDVWAVHLQHQPDLIKARSTKGEEGYIWWEDNEVRFETPEDLDKVEWTENGYLIPLYDSEHNRIGVFDERTIEINGVKLNKNTVEEIRAYLAQ